MKHSIGQLLHQGELSELTHQALRLKKINTLLQEILPAELAHDTRAVSFVNSCLLLEISNSSTATLLRYYTPTLLSQIRLNREFASIASIKQQIKPNSTPKLISDKKIQQRAPYSKKVSLLLSQVADKIQYEPLKQALLKLSEHLPK
ncbi:MAG: DciA family protein [Legionellales bacterium]